MVIVCVCLERAPPNTHGGGSGQRQAHYHSIIHQPLCAWAPITQWPPAHNPQPTAYSPLPFASMLAGGCGVPVPRRQRTGTRAHEQRNAENRRGAGDASRARVQLGGAYQRPPCSKMPPPSVNPCSRPMGAEVSTMLKKSGDSFETYCPFGQPSRWPDGAPLWARYASPPTRAPQHIQQGTVNPHATPQALL